MKLFSPAGKDKYTDAWERFPVQATDNWDFQKDMTQNECEKKLEGEYSTLTVDIESFWMDSEHWPLN